METAKRENDATAKGGIGLRPLNEAQRPFERINYLLMGGCLLLIIVGFALMTGPGSSAETGFNPDIFSTRRIVVGPTMAFLGFLMMAFAIVWKPKKNKPENIDTQSEEKE